MERFPDNLTRASQLSMEKTTAQPES